MSRRQKETDPRIPSTTRNYLDAKNKYFTSIKSAKRDHWNAFLEKEDPQSIFKAMSYTTSSKVQRIPHIQNKEGQLQTTFTGKCSALREGLFPPPPTGQEPDWESYNPNANWEWPETTTQEVKAACSSEVLSKSPGPEGITQEIITRAYIAIPDEMNKLFATLVDIGYHPRRWKQATGAILKKPNKPDDSLPSAYRVITLLSCLGKVSERIVAKRLGFLAEKTKLLHTSQMGGRLKKSAIDAALLLTNEVENGKRRKLKVSTIFMDVKNAYGHVIPSQLYRKMQKLGLPINLLSWVKSFLKNRELRIAFDGQIEEFTAIDAGVPQGSPISPILFLIYISDLFESNAVKFISYVDDITLTATSTTLRRNKMILEREITKMCDIADQGGIQFDIKKTELIHWVGGKAPRDYPITLPDGNIIKPSNTIIWLGINFDPHLNFKAHVNARAQKPEMPSTAWHGSQTQRGGLPLSQ